MCVGAGKKEAWVYSVCFGPRCKQDAHANGKISLVVTLQALACMFTCMGKTGVCIHLLLTHRVLCLCGGLAFFICSHLTAIELCICQTHHLYCHRRPSLIPLWHALAYLQTQPPSKLEVQYAGALAKKPLARTIVDAFVMMVTLPLPHSQPPHCLPAPCGLALPLTSTTYLASRCLLPPHPYLLSGGLSTPCRASVNSSARGQAGLCASRQIAFLPVPHP